MSNTMIAAILHEHGGREAIRLEQVPVPEPRPGEVRVQVRACALNWLDVGIRQGPKFGPIPLPLIGGGDIAGVVDTVGADVTGWKAGDEILVYPLLGCGACEFCRQGELATCPNHRIIGEHVNGGLAEFTIVPAANLLPKPANLSFDEAAALPVVLMTAWHMLIEVGGLQAGEDVLISGAGGGVASMGIQIAHYAGARVFTTTSTPEKAGYARELGAAEVFNYREEDWAARAREVTNDRGVDLVQDNVGAATWSSALCALARNGRLVTCGSHSGTRVELEISQIYHRQLQILGSNGGTYDGLSTALALVEEGRIHPVIDSVLPLEQIREGHRLLEEGEHFGKVVIAIN
ncbi:MAG: zinc-binding dehydrogenase [Chloroflexota bacterium]|nr:zinc-binding dehydrogenase [Chloroflexota bacterium]